MRTAVEWLEMEIVKLEKDFAIPHRIYELCEQTKEMEKNQIIKTGNDFVLFQKWRNGEHYFNDKFSK